MLAHSHAYINGKKARLIHTYTQKQMKTLTKQTNQPDNQNQQKQHQQQQQLQYE